MSAHGHSRRTTAGETLVAVGASAVPIFLVLDGTVEVLRRDGAGEALVVTHGPGQFTGEASTLTGGQAVVRLRVSASGEVVEIDRAAFLRLVQTDAELSAILMRALLLRRLELTARGLGDAVVLGSSFCAGTLRVKEFLTRNSHPHVYVDLDADADAQQFLEQFAVQDDDIPVVICRGSVVLRNPANEDIAACLGLNEVLDESVMRDLLVVGAGPSGLAAAVYAASEGLDVVVLESHAPGGQAGSSSLIENYLGFPAGVSGQDLADRAHAQAQKFGAHVTVARSAATLLCDRRPFSVRAADGSAVLARSVVIATGARYRRPALERLPEFEGAGVYYGATPMEARLCAGEVAVIVGGGNSAGQAAIYLSQTAAHVYIAVRGNGLSDSM